MTVQYLPDARIEAKAIQLLNRYESQYDTVTGPPIPVEEIADNLLELGILWGSGVRGGRHYHAGRLGAKRAYDQIQRAPSAGIRRDSRLVQHRIGPRNRPLGITR